MHPIEADIRNWSKNFLEVPSDKLNGLPPCPYAKDAWLKNKVKSYWSHFRYRSSPQTINAVNQLMKKGQLLIHVSATRRQVVTFLSGLYFLL